MLVTRRSSATGEIRVLSLPITAEEAAALVAAGLIENAFPNTSEAPAPQDNDLAQDARLAA